MPAFDRAQGATDEESKIMRAGGRKEPNSPRSDASLLAGTSAAAQSWISGFYERGDENEG
jgi:hypothetical protein